MDAWPGRPTPMGSTPDTQGTNFAVYSASATEGAISLCLFADDGTEKPSRVAEARCPDLAALACSSQLAVGCSACLTVWPASLRSAFASALRRWSSGEVMNTSGGISQLGSRTFLVTGPLTSLWTSGPVSNRLAAFSRCRNGSGFFGASGTSLMSMLMLIYYSVECGAGGPGAWRGR